MANKKITSGHKKITSNQASSDPNFGERVCEARNEIGWTQPELSEETRKFGSKEICLNTICALETGRTRGSLVTRRVLNATITAKLKCEYPWKNDGDAINKNSLAKFIKDSALINRIDHDYSIAKNHVLRVVYSEEFVDFFVERMHLVKIKTIQALDDQLKQRADTLTKFGECWFRSSMNVMHFVPRGICISFLSNLFVLEKGGVRGLTKFLEQHRFVKDRDPRMLARGIKTIYDEARKELRAEH